MTAQEGQLKITVVPVTVPVANRYITHLHRHHAPLPGGFAWFCIAAVAGGYARGVAICGRPTNRNNAGAGQTIELLRLACDSTPNVASALLGASARIAKAMGAARIITYTLESESGISLRAAGWVRETDGIRTFWHTGHTRSRAVERDHVHEEKVRWALNFREPIEFEHTAPDQSKPGEGTSSAGNGDCALFDLEAS
jgi:hypothetical protein